VDEAQKIYEQVLKEDPGNPLALNNLAAIMVKKGQDQAALSYLQQALPRAKGYKLKINGVCALNGVCLAFRPLQEVYGNQDLEPLIRLNLQMVKAKMAAPGAK
jgi:tetratricopeptide (TPR) repeat protein